MNCICCGADDDHNRVAVERASGDPVGTVCVECEGALVRHVSPSTVLTMASCVACENDSAVLFPEWEFIVENDSEVTEFEFDISLTTLGLCLSCLTDVQVRKENEPKQYVGSESR